MECVVVVAAATIAIMLLFSCSTAVEGATAINFDTSSAAESSSSSLESFNFVSRGRFSFGYSAFTTGFPDGFGYGMGALQQVAFDASERIMYGLSGQGFVTLIDYSKGAENATHFPFVLRLSAVEVANGAEGGVPTDIAVCAQQGLLFVSIRKEGAAGVVQIYSAAQLSPTNQFVEPELRQRITVGNGPKMILPNTDCTVLAVANEAPGFYSEGETAAFNYVDDAAGTVSLVTGGAVLAVNTTVTEVSLAAWTDQELLDLDVHLPLSGNALQYWNGLGFDLGLLAEVRYEPEFSLEPEFLSWSPDGSRLYVSLQENNAMVAVDVESATATGIYSYGLKSWETTPIDVFDDDSCDRTATIPGFFTVRSPDSMTSVVVDGETYILIANEGADKAYGRWEEAVKAEDIFGPGGELRISGMVFDNDNVLESARPFFSDCTENDEVSFCAPGMRLTLGSSMIDYSNVAAPRVTRLVGFGGRGISLYRLRENALDLVWDSADELERVGCQAFPWAHNGAQDEEYAPLNGILYRTTTDTGLQEAIEERNDPGRDGCEDGGNGNPGACPLGKTVDERSLKDGPAPESLVVGVACRRLYAVTVGGKNSIAYLYDITNITSPEVVRVFHLSPASETKNPGVAYGDGSIGEIDVGSVVFLESGDSPTGRATLIFPGALSGTASVWEFVCTPTPAPTVSPAPSEAPVAPPTGAPVSSPTVAPTPLVELPSQSPSNAPSTMPSTLPSQTPSSTPSTLPSTQPVTTPSSSPSAIPSILPSNAPLAAPVPAPSDTPSVVPSSNPSLTPSQVPSSKPSPLAVTNVPTVAPTSSTPSQSPVEDAAPTVSPITNTFEPTSSPTVSPSSSSPTVTPSSTPTVSPTSSSPTVSPTSSSPTASPSSSSPTVSPSSLSPTSSPITETSTTPSPVRAVVPTPNVAPTSDSGTTESLGSGVIVAIVAVSVLTISLLSAVMVMVGRRQCQVARQAY